MTQPILINDNLINSNITPEKLKEIAKQKATEILEKIHNHSEKIAEAGRENDRAKSMKRPSWLKRTANNVTLGLFGEDDTGYHNRKINQLIHANGVTNTALAGLNDLVQESIHLTCTSVQFAQVMHETMAHMIVEGFRDSYGNLQELSGSGKEVVEQIMASAEDFVTKQARAEKKQLELHERIEHLHKISSKQEQRLIEFGTIIANHKAIEDAHDRSLQILFKHTKQKDQLDTEQNTLIEKLFDQQKIVKTALFFSALSLTVAIVTAVSIYL